MFLKQLVASCTSALCHRIVTELNNMQNLVFHNESHVNKMYNICIDLSFLEAIRCVMDSFQNLLVPNDKLVSHVHQL